ncbi:MAG: hypothetical protein M0R51_09060 [Clostridia bacterium]|jgi:hypothetical protein|nr:hypothetical protein [Clostridia bacterium]
MKFANIENNLVKLFSLIYSNENINKYIYYLNNDPINSPTVPVDLLEEGNFILGFFDGSISETEKIRLFLNPLSGILNRYPLSEITYLIEIVLPSRFAILHDRGEIRPMRIFDEISQMIDQQKGIGITEAEITRFRSGRIADTSYCVYSIEISINSSTLKGLR